MVAVEVAILSGDMIKNKIKNSVVKVRPFMDIFCYPVDYFQLL